MNCPSTSVEVIAHLPLSRFRFPRAWVNPLAELAPKLMESGRVTMTNKMVPSHSALFPNPAEALRVEINDASTALALAAVSSGV